MVDAVDVPVDEDVGVVVAVVVDAVDVPVDEDVGVVAAAVVVDAVELELDCAGLAGGFAGTVVVAGACACIDVAAFSVVDEEDAVLVDPGGFPVGLASLVRLPPMVPDGIAVEVLAVEVPAVDAVAFAVVVPVAFGRTSLGRLLGANWLLYSTSAARAMISSADISTATPTGRLWPVIVLNAHLHL